MNKKLRYLTQKLEKVNLLESWAEKYKPVKYEITKFNDDEKNLKWLTQFHHGCLLFSLLNGNFFELRSEGVFDFNLNFSHHIGRARSNMQIIVGVVHEYKAILLWYLLTKINVLGAGNMRCMHDMIHEMLNSTSKNKICELAKKLATIIWGYEERFAVKYKKVKNLILLIKVGKF